MSFHATNRLLSYIFGSRIFRYPSIRLAIDLAENDESCVLKLRRQHVTSNVAISCDDVVWKNFEALDRKNRFISTKSYHKKSLWIHAMDRALICSFERIWTFISSREHNNDISVTLSYTICEHVPSYDHTMKSMKIFH